MGLIISFFKKFLDMEVVIEDKKKKHKSVIQVDDDDIDHYEFHGRRYSF